MSDEIDYDSIYWGHWKITAQYEGERFAWRGRTLELNPAIHQASTLVAWVDSCMIEFFSNGYVFLRIEKQWIPL